MSEKPVEVNSDQTHDQYQQTYLITRLSNYTLVNSVFQQYNSLKAASPLLKAGLETAEGTTHKLVELAQPVFQPVITKIDSALHLEAKANKVLDRTEEIGQNLASAYQHGVTQSEHVRTHISNSTKGIVAKGKDAVQYGKDVVQQNIDLARGIVTSTVESGKGLAVYANRPVNQLLDVTEGLVDSILPPELELEPIDIHEDNFNEPLKEELTEPLEEEDEEVEEDPVPTPGEHLNANPLPRIKQIGGGVSKRVKRVALSKLQNLSFRSPSQVNTMGYVVDLIQYAADYIDYDSKKQSLKEAAGSFHNYIDEKKRLVSPAKEIIDKQTSEIKETAVKSVVAIVSTIAHATEVIRRQIIGQVPDVSQLQANLAEKTKQTKEAILKLQEPHLSEYIAYVRKTYGSALESLIALTHAYTPSALQYWSDSLFSRLISYPQGPSKDKTPETTHEITHAQ